VVEDVVDVLIKKKLIEITDFPIPAQQNLFRGVVCAKISAI
jgi:hypothetical protein